MKTKLTSNIRAVYHSFGGVVCAGAVLLIASGAPAQNLFEADWSSGNIYEFTPGGAQSTFASGLNGPIGLAFQDESLTTPEPSALGLMTVGVILLFVRCRCRGTAAMSQ